ncbi:MAG: C45 family autoproteolytic acyltransferase/hydrolase [Phreatobacter sp.]
MDCTFAAIVEDRPGPKWKGLFARHWQGYRTWFLRGGIAERPTYLACRRAVQQHMPEWAPVWETLTELAGGGDIEARFLSMWCPPPYIAGCTQAVWTGEGPPSLARNYDYPPGLIEGAWLATRWSGQRVVAMGDCLCGALDGINESGLAVSLSFGGRRATGQGFGIPIVLRYLLEFCATTREAARVLSRLPIHMTYSVTLLDRSGDAATVFVAPDRPAEVLAARPVANHQHAIEWPEHADATASVVRARQLEAAVADAREVNELVVVMLRPPLYQTAYERGYGTLYTVVYTPRSDTIELVWPSYRWRQTVSDFREGTHTVSFDIPTIASQDAGDGAKIQQIS